MFKKLLPLLIIFTLCIQVNAKSLIPGGESAGVNLVYDGVLVTGNYAFFADEQEINLNEGQFENGDLIFQCYDQPIKNTNDLISSIQYCMNNNLEIIVDTKTKDGIESIVLNVYYDQDHQTFKTGLYITDHITAIGTITYYDPETMTFGAFGHCVDAQNEWLNFEACELFDAYITSIDKNTETASGKKIGTIEKTKRIGQISRNTELGIFGSYETIYKNDLTPIETATPSIGEACLYTTLTDNQTNAYKIYIDKIDTHLQKITFHVTDQQLIDRTNGIIPGMSGSPIIQDGKLVGAVTHVLVNDPTKGYGIFIENMLQAAR